jgi:hypothetical protein
MAQTDRLGLASLALLRTSDRVKRSEGLRYTPDVPSALSSVTRVGARVALQRCPILRTSGMSVSCFLINPLQRGHFYFAE